MDKKATKVLVMASEGGGNHLLVGLLSSHPQLKPEDVLLKSMADGRLGHWLAVPVPPECAGVGFWVPISFLGKVDKTVLSTRSPVHAAFSSWKRFGSQTEGGIPMCFWYQLASRYYIRLLELSPYPTITTSYERVVQDTKGELARIATFLGLDPVWDFNVEGTRPYFDWKEVINRNDDRWKEDKEFCKEWDRYKELFDVFST